MVVFTYVSFHDIVMVFSVPFYIDGSYYCACMNGYELQSDNRTGTGNDCTYVRI